MGEKAPSANGAGRSDAGGAPDAGRRGGRGAARDLRIGLSIAKPQKREGLIRKLSHPSELVHRFIPRRRQYSSKVIP